jgi:hypothetical protein
MTLQEDSMRLSTLRVSALAAAGLAAVLAAGAPSRAAEAGAVKAPATLEDQLKVLNGALVESFATADWEMLEMVAKGAKAAGLKGRDLEIFALSAERDAALKTAPSKVTIITWGLAFRTLLGSEVASKVLRDKAFATLTPVERPKPGGAANVKAWQPYRQYQAKLYEQREALMALALLGEKRAGAVAWESILKGKTDASGLAGRGAGHRQLVIAVLAAEGEAGWKKLVGFCSFEEGNGAPFGIRVGVLRALAGFAAGERPGSRSVVFRVDGRISKTLPADAPALLRAAFVKMAGKIPAEGNPPYGIIYAAGSLPGFKEDAAAVEALKGLKGKYKGHAARSWDYGIDRIVKPDAKPAQKPASGGTPEKF